MEDFLGEKLTIKQGNETFSLSLNKYLICFLFGSALCWVLQLLWRRRAFYTYARDIPGPISFPLIGSTYLVWGATANIVETIVNIQNRYKDIAKLWFGVYPMFLISKPEYVGTILTNPNAIHKDQIYRIVSETIGNGLLTAPSVHWKKHRRMISPSFKRKILDSFVDIFAEQSNFLVNQLNQIIGQKNIDIYHYTSLCTMDIICQTALGKNMDIQKQGNDYGYCIEKMLETVNYRIFKLWLHFKCIWYFDKVRRTNQKYQQKFFDVIEQLLQEKIQSHRETMEHQENSLEAQIEEEYGPNRLTILDFALESSSFTVEELRDEVIVFIMAGTETTAGATSYIFTVMGMYPEIQQKVYEEVVDIIGHDRKVEAKDLPLLKYTERVIKETLRIFPVAPTFTRALSHDVDIGDYVLPKGSHVGINVMHIHRNPEYWKNPLTFDPDRFLPEEVAKRHPCTYIPFSYGPRNCIGDRYAMMSLKTIIATTIRHFKIYCEYKSIEEIGLTMSIVLRMKNGPKLRLEKRES